MMFVANFESMHLIIEKRIFRVSIDGAVDTIKIFMVKRLTKQIL